MAPFVEQKTKSEPILRKIPTPNFGFQPAACGGGQFVRSSFVSLICGLNSAKQSQKFVPVFYRGPKNTL